MMEVMQCQMLLVAMVYIGVGTDERGLLISETTKLSFLLRQDTGETESAYCVDAGIPQARTGR